MALTCRSLGAEATRKASVMDEHVADVVGDDVVRELVGGGLCGGAGQLDGTVSGGHGSGFPVGVWCPQGSHDPPTAPDRISNGEAPGGVPAVGPAASSPIGPAGQAGPQSPSASACSPCRAARPRPRSRHRALLHRGGRQAQGLGDVLGLRPCAGRRRRSSTWDCGAGGACRRTRRWRSRR